MLDAAVRRVPITGDIEHVTAPEGATIAEFVAIAFPAEAHRSHVVALVDGEEIAPAAWDRIPRAGEALQLVFRPGGRDFFRTLLQIAVIAVAVWVSGGGLGGWFAAGTWQAAVAAAGVSILGNLAINSLIPLPKPDGFPAVAPYYSLSSARNSARLWSAVPMLFGRHRIVPPRMSDPVQEVLGGVTYLRFALCLGLCPMQVSDWKIGETALSSFTGVEMEVRLNADDPPHTLITGDPVQDPVGATLTHTEWTTRTTATDVDEIEVIYDFPSGLGGLDSKGRKTARTVYLRLQYRPAGSSEDWTDWRPTVPQANDASAGAGVPYRPEYFTTEGDLIAWRGQLAGMGGVAGDIVPITRSDPGRAFRHSERFAVPRGQYDVRTQRTEAASTDPNIVDAVSWGVLGSIRTAADPFPNRKLATACFRIKASDQLSNMVDTLNCIAESLQPVFSAEALEDPTIADAGEFTTVATSSNPAELALLAMRGPNTAYPKPDEEVDWRSFASAAAKFAAAGLTFNEYVESDIGRWEMVNRILAAGHARAVKHNGRVSVVVDDSKAGQPPAQTFTPRNVLNFRWQKTFPRLPHAIRTPFANADNGWQADEVTVFLPNPAGGAWTAETATRYETVAMPGKTDADEIRTVVNQYARNSYFQTESFEFETDVEHLAVKRGDYCVVQHHAMATGLGAARIASREVNGGGDVTAIVLDADVETPVGESLAVQWRTIAADSGLARMEVIGEQAVTRDAANPRRFVFATPQSGSTKPAARGADYEGDIALVGIAGKVSFEVLIRDIRPRPHLRAAISCVAYAGERFVDAPDWPAHDPKVTRAYAPRPTAPTNAVPIASTLQIAVGFTQPAMPIGVELTGYRVARRESGSTGDSWEPLGPLGPDERIAIAPAGEPGADYDIRIIAVGVRDDGVTVYSDALIAAAVSAVTAPAAPAGCGGAFSTRTSSGGAQQLVLTATWTPNENPDVLDTVVEQRVSTGPDVWQEIGRGAAAAGRTEIHGLPVGRAYLLRFINISKRGVASTPTTIDSITAPDTLVATGAIAPAPGGALDDALDDIDTALAAATIAISDAEDRLDDAEDTLDLHGTDIGTLQTVTAGQATSISVLQARNTADQQASQNYLRNSTFYDGTEHWTVYGGAFRSAYADHTYILFQPNVGYQNAYQDVRVEAGGVYSVGGELYRDADNNARLYVGMLNEARDTSIGYQAVTDAPATGWTRVNGNGFTVPPGAAWARIYVDNYDNGIGAYGTSGAGGAARRLTFTRSTVAQPWSEAGDALPSFMDNRASIIEVAEVAADNESAIATLDSRLDVAETDIDGVQSTASNLSTRMAAVDGGSASATSIAQLKAAYGFGFNECADSEFLNVGAVWQNLYSASGSQADYSTFDVNQRRYLSRAMTGMTAGHQFNIGQVPGYGLQVVAGDRLEASLYWGVANAGRISNAVCYVDFYDVDGAYLNSQGAGSGSSPYTRIGGFVTAPAGAARATITGGFIASHASPDAHIQGPVFRKCSVEQTALSPYTRSADPSTLARVGFAEASITEIEDVNADQDSAIAVIDSRMDAAESDIDGVQSTASNLSTRMTAVDGGSASSTSISQLVARNAANQKNSQNMLRDSTFRASDRWTFYNGAVGQQTYLDHTYVWMPYGAHRIASQDVRVQPGVRYALSGDVYSDNDNEVRLYLQWLNEARDTAVGANSGYDGLFGNAGSANHPGWRHVTFDVLNANVNGGYGLIAPTGAVWARLIVDNWPGDGTVGGAAARRLKFEAGEYASAWSEDDGYLEARDARAEVVTVEEAIADEVSARAAFQTTAEADIGALEGSVTAQGSAIADIEDGLDLAYVIRLSGGDNEVSIEAALGGAAPSGVITMKANQVAMQAAALLLGDNTIFEDEYNTFYTESGGERFRFGGPFGASGNLFMWRGSAIVTLNTETKANSKFAILVDEDLPAVDGGTITTPTVDDQTKTGTAAFDNVTTSGNTVHTLATIDLTVGASGYLELLSPLFFGALSINQESGMTLSAGTDWFGQMIVTEQLQSGGSEYTLWTIPLQISDTGGGLFDFIFDPPVVKVVAQNVSGASRYRLKLQRTSGSNNVSGNGLQGKFTIRRTP